MIIPYQNNRILPILIIARCLALFYRLINPSVERFRAVAVHVSQPSALITHSRASQSSTSSSTSSGGSNATLASPTPLGDHTPPPQASLPLSDQTPTPESLAAPHDGTPIIRPGLPANDNGLAGSPPHTTKTQMVQPRPVNPAQKIAPAKLASATILGLHLLSRPPPAARV